jgi:hypothetical protein
LHPVCYRHSQKIMKKKKDNRYEEESFNHWLAMYNLHQDDWTKKSIEQQIELYKSIEGDEEFEGLKKEVKEILLNNDLSMFLDKAKKGTKLSDLEFMANTILISD